MRTFCVLFVFSVLRPLVWDSSTHTDGIRRIRGYEADIGFTHRRPARTGVAHEHTRLTASLKFAFRVVLSELSLWPTEANPAALTISVFSPPIITFKPTIGRWRSSHSNSTGRSSQAAHERRRLLAKTKKTVDCRRRHTTHTMKVKSSVKKKC